MSENVEHTTPELLRAFNEATELAERTPGTTVTVAEMAAILRAPEPVVIAAIHTGRIRATHTEGVARIAIEEVRRIAMVGALASVAQSTDYWEFAASRPMVAAQVETDTRG